MEAAATYRKAHPDGKVLELSVYQEESSTDDPLEGDWTSWFRFITAENSHYEWGHEQTSVENLTEEIEEAVERGATVVPVYAYVHSGVAFSLDQEWPFDCSWDAGQCGVLIWDKTSLKKAGLSKDADIMEKAADAIDTYSAWINGLVWRFGIDEIVKYDQDGEHREPVEGCGGYIGYLDDVIDQILLEAGGPEGWVEVNGW